MDPLFHFSWTTEILSLCVFSIEKKFLLLKESEKEGRKEDKASSVAETSNFGVGGGSHLKTSKIAGNFPFNLC